MKCSNIDCNNVALFEVFYNPTFNCTDGYTEKFCKECLQKLFELDPEEITINFVARIE